MCGRFISAQAPQVIADKFATKLTENLIGKSYEPRFNVAPGSKILVVESDKVEEAKWGLIPSWATDPKIGYKLSNARAETIRTKPSFRSAFAKRRCIIPVGGFYEWFTDEARTNPAGKPLKVPYFFGPATDDLFAFAGIWEAWHDKEEYHQNDDRQKVAVTQPALGMQEDDASQVREKTIISASIVTTTANDLMSRIHTRMPVMLDKSRWHEWCDPANHDLDALEKLLVPAPDDLIEAWEVSNAVNSSRSSGENLCHKVGDYPKERLI